MKSRSSLSILIDPLKIPESISVCDTLDLKTHSFPPCVQTAFTRSEAMILDEWLNLNFWYYHVKISTISAKNVFQPLIGYRREKLNDKIFTSTDTGVLQHMIELLFTQKICKQYVLHDDYQLNVVYTDEACSMTNQNIETHVFGEELHIDNGGENWVRVNKEIKNILHVNFFYLINKYQILFGKVKLTIQFSVKYQFALKKILKCICKFISATSFIEYEAIFNV